MEYNQKVQYGDCHNLIFWLIAIQHFIENKDAKYVKAAAGPLVIEGNFHIYKDDYETKI